MEKNKVTQDAFNKFARKMKVCGHPLRLRLLAAIENKEPCVSDLSSCIDESQPVVSQHLAVLKREGIVSSKVNGNKRIYSVSDPFIKAIVGSISSKQKG